MTTKIRTILVIDDDPIDRESYIRALTLEAGAKTEIIEAETGLAGLAVAAARHIDCVLLDYNLPDMDGLEVLQQLRDRPTEAEIPVIMLTGAGSEQVAVQTMQAGCQDYVVKDQDIAATVPKAVASAIDKVELRRELEAKRRALEESQREQLLLRDKFLSHVSHELRTPLAAVHQFISLCLDGLAGELTDLQREYLDVAFRNVAQLKAMIGDLMEVTRAETGKLRIDVQPTQLGPLLGEVAATMQAHAAENGIDLRHAPGARPLPPMLADATRVRQVLVNLIDNAIKFTPQGGHVTLKASKADDQFIQISVADSGCGIDADGQRKIFERLHQEQAEGDVSRTGLGLGLAICKELILLQGGRIWVESAPGEGSVFRFTLPQYSIANLVRPCVTENGELRETYGVLRIVLTLDPDSTGPLREDHLMSVRRLLRKLVYYESDVVLPTPWKSDGEGSLHVVGATDAEGVAAMLSRIRRRLEEHCTGHLHGVRVSVRGRVEETRECDRNAALEVGVDSVAQRISRLIQDPQEWKE